MGPVIGFPPFLSHSSLTTATKDPFQSAYLSLCPPETQLSPKSCKGASYGEGKRKTRVLKRRIELFHQIGKINYINFRSQGRPMKGKQESAFNEGKTELCVQFINKHPYNLHINKHNLSC